MLKTLTTTLSALAFATASAWADTPSVGFYFVHGKIGATNLTLCMRGDSAFDCMNLVDMLPHDGGASCTQDALRALVIQQAGNPVMMPTGGFSTISQFRVGLEASGYGETWGDAIRGRFFTCHTDDSGLFTMGAMCLDITARNGHVFSHCMPALRMDATAPLSEILPDSESAEMQ